MAVVIVMVMMMSVVVMFMMVVMPMAVVMVAVIIHEQPSTGEVHQQPHQRDSDRLLIVDRAGIEQPEHRLEQHQPSHSHQ